MLQVAVMSLVCSQDTRRAVQMAWLILRQGAALALQAMAAAQRRAAERRTLDARTRSDIGIGSCEAHGLAWKPLWHA